MLRNTGRTFDEETEGEDEEEDGDEGRATTED